MKFLRLGNAGMRGKIGTGLTPELITDFAAAMGSYLEDGTVIVARDTRFSSTMLYHAVVSALLSCGCRVMDAGVCPAPLLHFAVPWLNADAGLLLGAGHHPAGWNAIVPVAANGAYFNDIQTQELLDVYHSRQFSSRKWDRIGCKELVAADIAAAYLAQLCRFIDADCIRAGNLRVIADFCNGSGSVLADSFAECFGIEMVAINNIQSGILPHDPEPRPRSSTQVQSILKVLNADAGFVFNSDMSRTALVSSSGETLSEEYSFPLVADHVLTQDLELTEVVTNWCTTRTLDEIVRRHGRTVSKTRVGQAAVIDHMQDINARLAGDGSGSIALKEVSLGFDGYLAMALVLEAMTSRHCTSAELAEELPRYHIIKKSIPCPSAHAYTLLRGLKHYFADAEITEVDGFRFDWPDGWAHLRASVTEPMIRMIVEWNSIEEAEALAVTVRGQLERLVAS